VSHFTTPNEAVSTIESGNRVYIHGIAAAPQILVQAMADQAHRLRGVEVVQLHTEGEAPYADPALFQSFRVNALFVGSNVRAAVNEGRADYIPIFLSDVPTLFRSGDMPIDVALIQVSPPDRHGYCSLGISVEVTRAAIQSARRVIAQVNRCMPRTHGDGVIHVDEIDAMVEGHGPLPTLDLRPPSDIEIRIGKNVAELVEDGATIQAGIGAIPNAVLAALTQHRDLGIHSEMFSDGVIDLVQKGVITGALKKTHPGKLVASFLLGSQRLYDFVDDNPSVAMLDIGYVNDTSVIRRNPKVTAINSAIEVDLTGQVCADSIGTRMYSGVGGQMDFIRGAAQSEGGKPIIALPSITKRGASRIVPTLKVGAGVVTTRAHVHWVVTEHGAVNLHGKNLRQRAEALIALASPEHREELAREAHRLFLGDALLANCANA
jgi:4-hydroxybutyrate CoA-transferase